MQVILPALAIVCIHVGCEVVFEGPSQTCPLCGWQGIAFREIEAALTDTVSRSRSNPVPQVSTSTIH